MDDGLKDAGALLAGALALVVILCAMRRGYMDMQMNTEEIVFIDFEDYAHVDHISDYRGHWRARHMPYIRWKPFVRKMYADAGDPAKWWRYQ